MKLRELAILDEAVDDLDHGQMFYDVQQKGIGNYFVTSLLFIMK